MLHVILLESALELIPSEISSIKKIQQQAQKRKKKTTELLLDQNHHGQAMLKLSNHKRRGRPDIAYLCLMTLLESPLCKQGKLQVLVHLQDGRIIQLDPSVRLPRNYDRFTGLFEQILVSGQVPPKGSPLAWITNYTLEEYFDKIPGAKISLLAIEGGVQTNTQKLLDSFHSMDTNTHVIFGVGAFPHGDISESISQLFEQHIEMDPEIMMAWHVCAEVLWMYTHRIHTTEDRYSS